MAYDTSTLNGKCRYVMDLVEGARKNWQVCLRTVWMTFYSQRFFEDPGRGPCISIGDMIDLPTSNQVRREWNKILGEARRPKVEHAIPYYAKMP